MTGYAVKEARGIETKDSPNIRDIEPISELKKLCDSYLTENDPEEIEFYKLMIKDNLTYSNLYNKHSFNSLIARLDSKRIRNNICQKVESDFNRLYDRLDAVSFELDMLMAMRSEEDEA